MQLPSRIPLWTKPKPPCPRRLWLAKPSVAYTNSSNVNFLAPTTKSEEKNELKVNVNI
jgi:hypothetical protein